MRIILASASPRRKDILTKLAYKFETIPSTEEEPKFTELHQVKDVARFKAESVAKTLEIKGPTIIIGSDTDVIHAGKILSKPKTLEQAKEMIKSMSGEKHQVASAISLIKLEPGKDPTIQTEMEVTDITFRKLSDNEIENYVNNYEVLDKAGAYAIQEAAGLFVSKVEGCYNNVVGFPVNLFLEMIKRIQSK